MVVVLAFRLAIVLAPTIYRVTQSSQPSNLSLVEWSLQRVWGQLTDPDSDPDEVASLLNADGAESDPLWAVTDFTGTFELRKLQWRLSRAPTGGTVEDQDVMTFHFIKATGGTPGTYNDSTDLAAVESAANTFWTAVASWNPSLIHSDQYRWYKDGPAYWGLSSDGTHYVPIPGNPAIRVTEVDSAGSSGSANQMPPQVAASVTEKTSRRSSWGRFYFPVMAPGEMTNQGRFSTSAVDALAGACVSFYNSCRSASMVPVVWSIPKPERTTKGGGTLPAQGGIAYEVLSVQVDDLADIIRSRRYSGPTYRKVTALT